MTTTLTYADLSEVLQKYDVVCDIAEIQGIICGMLCGGMGHSQNDWSAMLQEACFEGGEIPEALQRTLVELFNQTCQQLIEGQFELTLLLPDDETPLNTRGSALIEWVNGFMTGFGSQQKDLTQCSDEVREALQDFADIARMEEPMNEDEESERAMLEVVEYVRISAIYCFGELGKSLLDDAPSGAVH